MRLRPMFLVPFWLYLWMSGSRYSLRRVIGNTLVAAIVAMLAGTGWFWAAKNVPQPYLRALPYVGIAAALAAAYTSLEPFLVVVRDSIASRRLSTGAIKQTGWGFTAWWAFAVAAALRWQVGKFAFLHAWLTYLHTTDYYFADVKFLVAVTLAVLPLAFAVRQGLIAFDGTPIAGNEGSRAPHFAQTPNAFSAQRSAQIPPGRMQQPPRPQAAPPPPPPPQQPFRSPYVVPPRPARIISVESTPTNERERGS